MESFPIQEPSEASVSKSPSVAQQEQLMEGVMTNIITKLTLEKIQELRDEINE